MNIMRWGEPFKEMEALRENVNKLFQESMGSGREFPLMKSWALAIDVMEDDDKFMLKAELPGMKKEEIDIEMTGDTLTIKGERKFEDEEKKKDYIRIERRYGQFQRSFTINAPVKSGEIKANYKDGILEITIPKAEEVKPKKVEVSVE